MKLDTKHLRYLSNEDWRVLTAVEIGSKNHEVVPTPLIIQLSNLRGGSGVHKSISTLAKANLIARTQNAKYDGYRLTYGGLDYLALHTHQKRNALYSTGPCIGAGKESDIYICAPPAAPNPCSKSSQQHQHQPDEQQCVLKIHRLGRISFRSIKNNRDYLGKRQSASWMYMSRLAAQKEFAFMKALGENGFNVPEALAWSRHTVVMSLIEGIPLRAVKEVGDPAGLYAELIEVILRFAEHGLIHGDFNEFNIMLQTRGEDGAKAAAEGEAEQSPLTVIPYIIDFPQAVSVDHADAKSYFDRDVHCIKTFFDRRFHFQSSEPGPFFEEAKARAGGGKKGSCKRIDIDVEASGFSRQMAKELHKYMENVGANVDTGVATDEEISENEEDNDKDGMPVEDHDPRELLHL